MATVETSGIIKYKDSNGDMTYIYPVTRKDCVSGMDEIDAHLVDKNNPHDVTPEQIGALSGTPINMTSSDGVSYTATVPGLTVLTPGVSFIGLPTAVSTSQSPKLTVNGLTTKYLRRRVSVGSGTTASGYSNDWIAASKPIKLIYDGTFWVVDSLVQASASDLMGTVPIEKGGTGATSANAALTNLGAVSQETFDNLIITRAKLADDALYSPMVTLNANYPNHAISVSDIGKTIYTHSGTGNSYVITLDAAADANIPVGAEIAICRFFGDSLTVTMSGVVVCHSEAGQCENGLSFIIPENYSMIALKKILSYSGTGYWLVTGSVEVVE